MRATTVRIRLFAAAREAVGGVGELRWEVPAEGRAAREILAALAARYPHLGPVLRASRIARDGRYLRAATARIRPGEELSIHPPYSGG